MYAVIRANANTNEIGAILAERPTLKGIAYSYMRLRSNRWAYVAERRPDGSYPHRVEALDLPAHTEAVEMALALDNAHQR